MWSGGCCQEAWYTLALVRQVTLQRPSFHGLRNGSHGLVLAEGVEGPRQEQQPGRLLLTWRALDENTTIYSTGFRLSALSEVDERMFSIQEVEICRQKSLPVPSGAGKSFANL